MRPDARKVRAGRYFSGRDDGAPGAMCAIGGPPLVLDFREAGARQPLGQFVNGPAIGRHDFVVEGGNIVTVEEADYQGASRGDYSAELSEYAIEILRK